MNIYFDILPEELNKLILFNLNDSNDLINLKDMFNYILSSPIFWKQKLIYDLITINKEFVDNLNLFEGKLEDIIINHYDLIRCYLGSIIIPCHAIKYKCTFRCTYLNNNKFDKFASIVFKYCNLKDLVTTISNNKIYRYEIKINREGLGKISLFDKCDELSYVENTNKSIILIIIQHFNLIKYL